MGHATRVARAPRVGRVAGGAPHDGAARSGRVEEGQRQVEDRLLRAGRRQHLRRRVDRDAVAAGQEARDRAACGRQPVAARVVRDRPDGLCERGADRVGRRLVGIADREVDQSLAGRSTPQDLIAQRRQGVGTPCREHRVRRDHSRSVTTLSAAADEGNTGGRERT
jgi:hypothetical protein